MSAFVNVLLMTRRRRSEPVSGANVKPDFRTSETASASATENASARSDGQRDRDLRLRELGREARDERLDLRVVRRGERQEADLAPARLVDERLRRLRDVGGVQLAHGAVPVAGLAEAAALRAAAHDLEAEAVLDDVDGRDHRLLGIDVGRELLDPDALHVRGNARRVWRVPGDPLTVVRHVVERRDVDPGAEREGGEALLSREAPRRGDLFEEDSERLLGVADQEGVEEVRERLGIRDARAAADDDRVRLAALRCEDGDPREVEHVRDVRVVHLALEREAEDVEVADGREGLDGEERDLLAPQDRLEVRPRRVRPLAGPVRAAVHDLVEDLRPRVAHPDLVGVGKGEAHRDVHRGEVLAHDVPLQAEVAPGALDGEEKRLEAGADGGVAHGGLPNAAV